MFNIKMLRKFHTFYTFITLIQFFIIQFKRKTFYILVVNYDDYGTILIRSYTNTWLFYICITGTTKSLYFIIKIIVCYSTHK